MSVRTWTVPSSTRPAAGARWPSPCPARSTRRRPVAARSRRSPRPSRRRGWRRRRRSCTSSSRPARRSRRPGPPRCPAAGLAIVTDSSESPSALCPARTQVPVVQLKTNRSRSAAGSDGLPIVARSEVEPGRDVDRVLLLREVGDASAWRRMALPSVVPDRPAGERAEQVGDRVAAGHRHADRRRGDHVRVRRDARAEDRRGQRERRATRVGGAPRLDRHLPDARPAGSSSCGWSRLPVRSRPARRVVAVGDRVEVDADAVRVEAQEADLPRAGAAPPPGQVDLEGRRARRARGRSSVVVWLRPIVPVLVTE